MTKRKISLTLIATLIAASTGVLGASSLAELRAEHRHQGVDQHRIRMNHSTAHKTVKNRRVDKDKAHRKNTVKTKAIAKRAGEKRKLARAKTVQKRIDRKLHKKHAKRRHFKTAEEFRKVYGQRTNRRDKRHASASTHKKVLSGVSRRQDRWSGTRQRSRRWQPDNYGTRWGEDEGFYGYWEPRHTQRGYRHARRSWYLTYLYERASFYDRHGYKYGYFSRRGFMFEGEFYRYDRQYSYRDRLRGRGLFERRYYRPSYSQFGDFFAQVDRRGSYFYAELDF